MGQYGRTEEYFIFDGLDLVHPGDEVPAGKYQIAQNVRSYTRGQIESRPGLAVRNVGVTYAAAVHSMRRLNDSVPGDTANALIVGSGTNLYTDASSVAKDTGYSGNPLTMVPFNPPETPVPYMYIGDSSKNAKINTAGTAAAQGIFPPTAEPTLAFGTPNYTVVDDMEAVGSWTTAGVASAISVVNRINDTISHIVFDSGTTGWASIAITTPDASLRPGTLITLSGTEEVLIQSVYRAVKSTTIAAIQYDSGTTGSCSVILTDNVGKFVLDKYSMLIIDSEAVTVTDVSWGPDDLPCLRLSTTINHTAGASVTGVISFRAHCTVTHAVSDTAIAKCFSYASTAAGGAKIDLHTSFDLSSVGGRPVQKEDVVHVALKISDLSKVDFIRVLMDFDATVALQNFQHNAYVKEYGPNDFVNTVSETETILQARLDRLQRLLESLIARQASPKRIGHVQDRLAKIDSKLAELGGTSNIPFSTETVFGDNQWSHIFIRVSELEQPGVRIGADTTRGLGEIDRLRINVHCTDVISIEADDWWIAAGYGPDVGDLGAPYQYRQRYRASTTGVVSTWGPASYTGISPHRERVILSGQTSGDAQVDQSQWARWGGSITEWKFIGTSAVGSSFNDDFLDDALDGYPGIVFDDYQPWVIQDVPHSGVVNVTGVSVSWVSGDTFNTSWAEGTLITLPTGVYTLNGPPLSTTLLLIKENAGHQSSVTYHADAPVLMAQPMPVIFGPYGYGQIAPFLFALGDPKNPGTLYWSKGNNFDAASDKGHIQLTDPSEPLMTGGIYEGQVFVGTADRMLVVNPAFASDLQGNPLPDFVAQEIPNSKGVISHWAQTTTPKGVAFVAGDGIYITSGGAPVELTGDLYPLFPHEGIAGTTVNGVVPPDFSVTSKLRLAYADDYLYFDFQDTGGALRTLVMNLTTGAWNLDIYTPTVLTHYEEEGAGLIQTSLGGNDGVVYTFNSLLTDNGTNIAGHVRTRANNGGEPRIKKNFGDAWLDINTTSQNVTVLLGFDNHTTTQTPAQSPVNTASRSNTPLDITTGAGLIVRNADLDLTWSVNEAPINLYAYGWTAAPKVEDTFQRYTDGTDLGTDGPRFLQGFRLHANTYGVNKSITVQLDNGSDGTWQNVATLTVNHAQESIIDYSLPGTAFASSLNIGHRARLKINDTVNWALLEDVIWVSEPAPPLVFHWQTQGTTLDLMGYSHIRDMYLPIISTGISTLTITNDENDTFTYSVPSTAGVHEKQYIVVKPMKGRLWFFTLDYDNAPADDPTKGVRVFVRDIEVRAKAWGSAGPYEIKQPFGDLSRQNGARI